MLRTALAFIMLIFVATAPVRAEMNTKRELSTGEFTTLIAKSLVTGYHADIRPFTQDSINRVLRSLFVGNKLNPDWLSLLGDQVIEASQGKITIYAEPGGICNQSTHITAIQGEWKWSLAFSAGGILMSDSNLENPNQVWIKKNHGPKAVNLKDALTGQAPMPPVK